MRFLASTPILATGDLTKYVRCDHATYLDHATKSGKVTPLATRPPSRMTELLVGKGEEHEQAYVERLRAAGKSIVTIEKTPWNLDALHGAESETLQAMRSGADYVCQAAFFDGRWNGYADLLERIDRPSPVLGPWSYEVVDTKLSRTVKAHFLLQLADYSSHVARLQGTAPEAMHVVLGTYERVSFRVDEYAAYHRHVRHSLERFAERKERPAAFPVRFCALCEWWAHCSRQWEAIDHLSLVANVRRTQVTRLERSGIATMTALAEAPPLLKVRRIADDALQALRHQARLQVEYRTTRQHKVDLRPLEEGRGFARLPRPSAGDVFFDVEGDPFAGDGLTYLFGAAWEEDGAARYACWWAHDQHEERKACEAVMDFIAARRRDHADAHVYHYGAMEVSTLKRLTCRYGTRESELDDLLRREAFVDLSAVIRQGMRISHSGYGLKKVETFYFTRQAEGVADADGAVLAYEQWLDSNDPAMLREIEAYNREDCLSTVEMRRWLLGLRPPEAKWKEPQEPRQLGEDRMEEDQRNDTLYQQLVGQGQSLLAHLLYYHRREERPAWWWFFARQKMDAEELIDDGECIGALKLDESVPPEVVKKSRIFSYRYPGQEHKFDPGDDPCDTADGERAGEIVSIDDAARVLRLKRGPSLLTKPHPKGLMPGGPLNTAAIREALQRFAASVAAGSPLYRAGLDILLSHAPRVTGDGPLAGVSATIRRLDESYLFVQGPPGSGKTWNGARAIVELLRMGKRVGVTSNSHAAIHNLLHEIETVARAENWWFRGIKKSREKTTDFVSRLPNPMIVSSEDTDECANAAVPLVAGTVWLFSDEAMDQSLDYLFIDEAGQVSLANALAASAATRNVVLLGDPLQLAQVSKGEHPDGAGASVLEHLLGAHGTVPPERGVFLEETRRMHPAVSRSFPRSCTSHACAPPRSVCARR